MQDTIQKSICDWAERTFGSVGDLICPYQLVQFES